MALQKLLVYSCVLIPMGGDAKILLWSGNGLYHHVLCPVISTASYIIIEKHAGGDWIWLPVALTFIYGMVMLYLNGIRKVDGPYPFFRVHDQSVSATVLWMCVLLAVMAGFSALVWVLAR